jgi:uncharacterized protein (DUF1810 family)
MTPMNDPLDLSRFLSAQEGIYASALAELRRGQKSSHWMWFIFPQVEGLGHSSTSRYYSIKNMDEACAYLSHPALGPRLVQCAETLLEIKGRTAQEIFDFPDDVKLKSSMTLFAYVAGPGSVFTQVLEKYFDGKQDERTQELLGLRD